MNAVNNTRLLLASASPRRLQLLQQIGFEPVCMPVSIDESQQKKEPPEALVARLARQKAEQCVHQLNEADEQLASGAAVVLGADTVIDLDGEVLGKPASRDEGVAMLMRLADREHSVLTGVCVLQATLPLEEHQTEAHEILVSTQVRFGPVSEEQADSYWNSGEPADKAGCYAIQGIGAQFVAYLSGSYSNVVGLPLYETNRLLRLAGVSVNYSA